MTIINRVGTLAQHSNLLRDLNFVQADLASLQDQISSGYKARNFEGFNGQVELFTNLEAKIRRSRQYQDNNTVVLTRLRQTGSALTELVDTANQIENLIVQRRSAAGQNDTSFSQIITSFRSKFAGEMNANISGVYLFSGTRTDVPAVIEPIPDPVVPGTPDTGYYQGSEEDVVARIQDNYELTYNVRGDDPAFQKVFAGVARAIEGHGLNNDDFLKEAFDLVHEGLQELIGVQATVNANIVNVDQVNTRHKNLELYWQGVTEEISKTDILAATTKVAIDQGILSASFQSFARISSLRLSDFL